ncbi:MAG: lichenicidin A2 family type 2 lantibiotic [Pseudobutyrivibrio sp.]|nr:lichenicidin A2 family type 2 lantibiotic [Pseudobutyrivibrio sp.]
MRGNKFLGDAFEELTIDEMKLVQGSGNTESGFNIPLAYADINTVVPSLTVSPVSIKLN